MFGATVLFYEDYLSKLPRDNFLRHKLHNDMD